MGVIKLASEATPEPLPLIAATLHSVVTPGTKPVSVSEVAVVDVVKVVQSVVPLELINPRSTLYPIMGRPLFQVGAAHVRVAEFDETEEKTRLFGADGVELGIALMIAP